MSENFKSVLFQKVSKKEASVKNIIDLKQITKTMNGLKQMAEDQIYLIPNKSQENLKLNQQNLSINSKNIHQQANQQLFPSQLQLKWRKFKQKITNTSKINILEQDVEFIFDRETNDELSGYTIVDNQTDKKIDIKDYIKKQQQQQIKKQDKQNCNKQSSLKSRYTINLKKHQQNRINQKQKNISNNYPPFNFSKNKKSIEYQPEKDKNLINFFTNKRQYLTLNKDIKDNTQNSMRQKCFIFDENGKKYKQTAKKPKNQYLNLKNRHTFTNDNQNYRIKDKQNIQRLFLDKNNKLKIRPQTVKCGYSTQQKQFNANKIFEQRQDLKIKPLSKLSLTQCQINAIINSNANQNKKIAKLMSINQKFYQKYCQYELINFISLNLNENKSDHKNVGKVQIYKDTERANYKLINQNQQKLNVQKQDISVKQQRGLLSDEKQMERQLIKLQTKVHKKLPYLLKMGVKFKLKQKKKQQTKY